MTRQSMRVWVRLLAISFGFFTAPVIANELVISHERSGDLIWMDMDGRMLDQKILCRRPRGMVQHISNRRLYVACSDDNAVLEIDLTTRAVLRSFPNIVGAMSVALFADQQRLLVSNEGAASATVIALEDGRPLAQVATGFEPDGVAISNASGRFFVASETNGLVHVFDSNSYMQVGLIRTHLRPRRLALDEQRGELWVSSEMGSRVEIFSLNTLKKIDEVVFAPKGFRPEQLTPVDILLPTDSDQAYVALGSANNLAVVNRLTREIEQYVLVGRRAWGLARSLNGQRLFVLNGLSDDMTLVDLSNNRPIRTVRTGLVPHAILVIQP